MKTVSIINLKGGVGKTTTAINMAQKLSDRNYQQRVLLIDNDKQGNTSQFFKKYDKTINCGTNEILRRLEPTVHHITDTLDLISANMTLEAAEYEVLAATDNQASRLEEYLDKVADQYDYCIIDNAPAVSMCVINALCASDEAIITIKLDDWSLEGVNIISEQINNIKTINRGLKVGGVLLTAFKRTENNYAAEEWLRKNCRYHVFDTKIRYSDKMDAWTYSGEPLDDFSNTCAAAVDYRKFIREYMGA